jgi:hypothetical protein
VTDFRGIFGCGLIRCGGEGFGSKWKVRERKGESATQRDSGVVWCATWHFGFGENRIQ